jgi:hypothetical protein
MIDPDGELLAASAVAGNAEVEGDAADGKMDGVVAGSRSPPCSPPVHCAWSGCT